MPGGERDDGLSPVCYAVTPQPPHPFPPLQHWVPSCCTKKTKDIFTTIPSGGEQVNCSFAFSYQNATNLTILLTRNIKTSSDILTFILTDLCRFEFFFCDSFQTDNRTSYLSCKMKDLDIVFSQISFSSAKPTHKDERTDLHTLYSLEVWDIEQSFNNPQWMKKNLELFGRGRGGVNCHVVRP